MAKNTRTGLDRLRDVLDDLREITKSMDRLAHPEEVQQQGPKWRWTETPNGGAALLGEDGELLVKAEWMPKPHVARAIAAAPDLRKEKFGILFDRRFLTTNGPDLLARVDQEIHALLFLDLDGMKMINDRLGHDIGDEVLQIYFASVAFVVNRIGEAYCWGGDEVVVLLPGHDQARAEALRDEIVATVVKKCSLHSRVAEEGIAVGLSGGIHVFDETEPLESVVKRADAAMYGVKKAKKAALSAPTT